MIVVLVAAVLVLEWMASTLGAVLRAAGAAPLTADADAPGSTPELRSRGPPPHSVRLARPTAAVPVPSVSIRSPFAVTQCQRCAVGRRVTPDRMLDSTITTDYNNPSIPTSSEGAAGPDQREFC